MTDTKLPYPRFPGGPDPDKPIPHDPVHGVDVRACGAIAGAIARTPGDRAAIFARHGIDEARWREVEQTWMLRIAASLLVSDLSLQRAYDDGCAEAMRGGAAPDLALEDYAALVAAIEAGRAPAAALAQAGLSVATWASAHSAWAARIAADPALASEFRRLVAARRSTLQ